jgi:hypothetical protein
MMEASILSGEEAAAPAPRVKDKQSCEIDVTGHVTRWVPFDFQSIVGKIQEYE